MLGRRCAADALDVSIPLTTSLNCTKNTERKTSFLVLPKRPSILNRHLPSGVSLSAINTDSIGRFIGRGQRPILSLCNAPKRSAELAAKRRRTVGGKERGEMEKITPAARFFLLNVLFFVLFSKLPSFFLSSSPRQHSMSVPVILLVPADTYMKICNFRLRNQEAKFICAARDDGGWSTFAFHCIRRVRTCHTCTISLPLR